MRVRWSGLSFGDLALDPVERNVSEVVANLVMLLGCLFESGAIIERNKERNKGSAQHREDERKDIPREPIGYVFERGQHVHEESTRGSDRRELGESLVIRCG